MALSPGNVCESDITGGFSNYGQSIQSHAKYIDKCKNDDKMKMISKLYGGSPYVKSKI